MCFKLALETNPDLIDFVIRSINKLRQHDFTAKSPRTLSCAKIIEFAMANSIITLRSLLPRAAYLRSQRAVIKFANANFITAKNFAALCVLGDFAVKKTIKC